MPAHEPEQRHERSSTRRRQSQRREVMDKTELYARDISGVTWRKSRYSEVDMNECVEVTELGDGAMAVRDSNNPGRPDLRFTASEWVAFVAGVRDGEF
jgi:hypothetical protein